MNQLLITAEMLNKMGANVLPIWKGKQPAIEWAHLSTEKQLLQDVQSYDWQKMTGLGIINGPSGYLSLDLDKIKNHAIIAMILKKLNLPEEYEWQVKSGSGIGYHLWVRIHGSLPFDKGVIWGESKDESFDHLEIRWKESQTIVPPSIHESGKTYQWVHSQPSYPPMEVSIEYILNMFEEVAVLRTDDQKKEKPKYERTRYSEIISHGVDEGKRNDTITSMAGHLRKTGIVFSETLEWLRILNNTFSAPLDRKEIETIVESIYSYPSTDIVLRNGLEMTLMKPPVCNDIVDGIIGEKSYNIIAGEEGSGKSLLAMNLGIAVATGLPKFLGFNIRKHGKVLFLNNELNFSVFLKRFKSMRTALFQQQSANLGNFITPEFIGVMEDKTWEDIHKIIIKEQPIMVILDCLYFAHDQKENDATEMKILMRKLLNIRDKYNLALVVVHHTKKGSREGLINNDNIRGSQVISSSADTNIIMRRSQKDVSQRVIKPTKLRNGTDGNQQARLMELDTGSLWFEDKGFTDEEDHYVPLNATGIRRETSIDWKVIFGADSTLKRKEIIERCKKVGIEERTADRRLKLASDHGVITKPKNGLYQIIENDDQKIEQTEEETLTTEIM